MFGHNTFTFGDSCTNIDKDIHHNIHATACNLGLGDWHTGSTYYNNLVCRTLKFPEATPTYHYPVPINIIFNNPATIVYWDDGTKTVVKIMEGDVYDEIIGVSMAYTKKLFGTNSNFKKMVKSFYPKPKVLPEPVKDIVKKKKKPVKKTNLEISLENLVTLLRKNISGNIIEETDTISKMDTLEDTINEFTDC